MPDDAVTTPMTSDGPRSEEESGGPGGEAAAPSGGAPEQRKRPRALRGATTVEGDTPEQVTRRTQALLTTMVERNGVDHGDIVSVLFTATGDIHSMFPATAARAIGFGDVPLMCARELDITGATPLCIRVMMHVETARQKLHHIYLEGARGLRDDLPE
jgi:chorismate mutase